MTILILTILIVMINFNNDCYENLSFGGGNVVVVVTGAVVGPSTYDDDDDDGGDDDDGDFKLSKSSSLSKIVIMITISMIMIHEPLIILIFEKLLKKNLLTLGGCDHLANTALTHSSLDPLMRIMMIMMININMMSKPMMIMTNMMVVMMIATNTALIHSSLNPLQ